MRTSSKFVMGKGYEDFCETLKNYYPAGKITLFTQDVEEGEKLARLLSKGYTVSLYKPSEAPIGGARFFIGMGGSGVISAVKRAAKDAKYAFIPAVFDYRFLHNFDGEFTLPEFVFLQEKTTSEKDFCLRLYVTVFQLYAELIFRLFYISSFPFRDKTLEGYRLFGEKILLGEEDKRDYFSEGIRFVTNVTNELYARREKGLVTEKAAEKYGVSSGERFQATFFLLLTLINFTKYPFCDILLPSEKRGEAEEKGIYSIGKTVLPSAELLQKAKETVSFLTEMPDPDITALLQALRESAAFHPVFSIIDNKGIIDALYYERSQKHQGISV